MWRSDRWKDYELIDCSRGEKLERWGDQLLVRPDPQAIWNTPRTHRGWKHNAGRYARSSSGGGQWQNKSMPERWTVSYGSLTFNIKPMNFKHTGLFPEQAANWDWAQEQIQRAGRPINVLNLFVPFAAPTSAGAIAIAASLIVAPLVSLFTPKLSQAHLDVTFSCYDERIAAPHKLILEQVSE